MKQSCLWCGADRRLGLYSPGPGRQLFCGHLRECSAPVPAGEPSWQPRQQRHSSTESLQSAKGHCCFLQELSTLNEWDYDSVLMKLRLLYYSLCSVYISVYIFSSSSLRLSMSSWVGDNIQWNRLWWYNVWVVACGGDFAHTLFFSWDAVGRDSSLIGIKRSCFDMDTAGQATIQHTHYSEGERRWRRGK